MDTNCENADRAYETYEKSLQISKNADRAYETYEIRICDRFACLPDDSSGRLG